MTTSRMGQRKVAGALNGGRLVHDELVDIFAAQFALLFERTGDTRKRVPMP